jgi:poly-gamma-glutamate capsule biosynthesis protein CapA/YwtB (metallophosphatase superfamily)
MLAFFVIRSEFSSAKVDFMGRFARLWFVGDVMLARGIDMIQRHSCNPTLYEGNGLNAHDYTRLAISLYGPIPDASQRGPEYVWGDTLQPDFEVEEPDLRIINLETSISTSMKPWPHKAVHYKMHPLNIDVIKVV